MACGNTFASTSLFFFFIVVVMMIFLNLFIAIILEGFEETKDRNEKMFNSEVREQFREIWSIYD